MISYLLYGLLKVATESFTGKESAIWPSVKKIQNIINDLADARKEEHKYKANDELLNFENILEDVHFTLLHNIKQSGAVITTELNVSEITFSRRKLRSIIYNLLNNAIKFKSPDRKPEIHISTILDHNYVILSIKDNGIGIDDAKQKNIFSKYYRAQNEIEGSGIGLYLVKEIVENAGGKISLKSVKGKGSEFKIYLKQD